MQGEESFASILEGQSHSLEEIIVNCVLWIFPENFCTHIDYAYIIFIIKKGEQGWRHGSSSRASALQVGIPEFTPQDCKKKKISGDGGGVRTKPYLPVFFPIIEGLG
jgi:hypothetical protein